MIGYVLMFNVLLEVASATSCYYTIYHTYAPNYYGSTYCYNGCCNSNTNVPCCSYSYSDYSIYSDFSLSVGAIIGIVIGVLVAIATVVTIAVCLCCACARSTPSTQGHVITSAQPTVSYVATSNQTGMQGYSQPYGVHDNSGFVPPPAYNHTAMPAAHHPS
ncbi:cysteine and tyrosine-rich protein 1-like [Mytilus trossulus]|uniref:cysteine and tyrosine-rich protein 1-like n=1 Tax=Mytilus trossulus TaxID=6551 RepID=UPI0030055696